MSVRQAQSPRIFSTAVIIAIMLALAGTAVWQRNAIRARWYARRLTQAENPADLAYAASALASLGSSATGPALQLLDNPRPDIRVLATLIVGRIGDPAAADGLIRALSDNDLDVRVSAAAQLGLMPGSDRLVPRLADMTRIAPRDSAMAAAVALEKIPPDQAASALRDLARSRSDAVIRAQAVECLGRRRDPNAIPTLVSRLADLALVDTPLLGEYRDDRVLSAVMERGVALPNATTRPTTRIVADFAERSLEQITGKSFKPIAGDGSPTAKARFWADAKPLDPTSLPADLSVPTSE